MCCAWKTRLRTHNTSMATCCLFTVINVSKTSFGVERCPVNDAIASISHFQKESPCGFKKNEVRMLYGACGAVFNQWDIELPLKGQWSRRNVYSKALTRGDDSQPPYRHHRRTFAGCLFLSRVLLKFPSGSISSREFELVYERSRRGSSLAIVGDAQGIFRRG